MTPTIIQPNWPAPPQVKSFTTTRQGGYSQSPYNELNLGFHVGDDPHHVSQNRSLLKNHLPQEPFWLEQTHSDIALEALSTFQENPPTGDASYTHHPHTVCCVLTADCLPILLCNEEGTQVAAIHGGWRGLAKGILEKTILQMNIPPHHLMAWLGPAIGPQQYEVGIEVYDAFLQKNSLHEKAFLPQGEKKWLANLYLLATQQLNQLGIQRVYGGEYCTFSNHDLFFSHRREGTTGRMASCIWLEAPRST